MDFKNEQRKEEYRHSLFFVGEYKCNHVHLYHIDMIIITFTVKVVPNIAWM